MFTLSTGNNSFALEFYNDSTEYYNEIPAHCDKIQNNMNFLNSISQFWKLRFPEKIWVMLHPFNAKDAWRISHRVLEVTKIISFDSDLDGDENGGQVDAFRHCFWMALLCQNMNHKIAYKLGKAHEKGNKIDFKHSKPEEGSIPDKISTEMDLKNNEVGIKIYLKNKNLNEEQLIQYIKKAILNGELWIIKKDKLGNCLDWYGNILKKDDYHGKWYNKRCLVPSDFIRP